MSRAHCVASGKTWVRHSSTHRNRVHSVRQELGAFRCRLHTCRSPPCDQDGVSIQSRNGKLLRHGPSSMRSQKRNSAPNSRDVASVNTSALPRTYPRIVGVSDTSRKQNTGLTHDVPLHSDGLNHWALATRGVEQIRWPRSLVLGPLQRVPSASYRPDTSAV
jgi:hypothetical protein